MRTLSQLAAELTILEWASLTLTGATLVFGPLILNLAR